MLLAAVLVGLLWLAGGIDLGAPQPERVALLVVGLGLAFAVARVWRGAWVGPAVGVYAVLIAAAERIPRTPLTNGSDVLRATDEALRVTLAGGNPYAHFMTSTIPPGSPFGYPPGELLWYLPAHLWGDIARVDTVSGILIAAILAAMGLRTGFGIASLAAMLYASTGILAFRAVDGSNDVSASLLVVASVAALVFAADGRRAEFFLLLSAVALGWAIAFKQFAILVVPPLVRYLAVSERGWKRYLAIVGAVAVGLSLPFFVRDPGAFVGSQVALLTFHQEIWGANLPATLRRFIDVEPLLPAFGVLQALATAAALLFAVRARISSVGLAALIGAGLIMIPLLFARWTTQPYYVYVAAVALVGFAASRDRAASGATT